MLERVPYRVHFWPDNEPGGFGFTIEVSPEFLEASRKVAETVDENHTRSSIAKNVSCGWA